MLGKLAELLGSQIAAARPVVDNDWLSHEEQIGQSDAPGRVWRGAPRLGQDTDNPTVCLS